MRSSATSAAACRCCAATAGLSGDEQEVLYCVVTRLEVGRVKTIVRAHDRSAFVVYHALADVDGGVVKRPRHH